MCTSKLRPSLNNAVKRVSLALGKPCRRADDRPPVSRIVTSRVNRLLSCEGNDSKTKTPKLRSRPADRAIYVGVVGDQEIHTLWLPYTCAFQIDRPQDRDTEGEEGEFRKQVVSLTFDWFVSCFG